MVCTAAEENEQYRVVKDGPLSTNLEDKYGCDASSIEICIGVVQTLVHKVVEVRTGECVQFV